jgi:hypothetical protein
MTARRFLVSALLAVLAFFCPGCVALLPDHITYSYKRDRNVRTGKATTDEAGVAATYDLPK